jgi:hypothetical protein
VTADERADLIARLEAAEVGSRDLDAAIWLLVVEKPRPGGKVDRDMFGRWPAFTTSLDAALALAERVLPGCFPGVQKNRWTFHDGLAWSAYITPADDCGEVERDGAIPALALCCAVLAAAPKPPQ